jgi:hypothetical protein
MNRVKDICHLMTPSSAFGHVGLAHEAVVYAREIQHFWHGTSEYGNQINCALVAKEQELRRIVLSTAMCLLELSAH